MSFSFSLSSGKEGGESPTPVIAVAGVLRPELREALAGVGDLADVGTLRGEEFDVLIVVGEASPSGIVLHSSGAPRVIRLVSGAVAETKAGDDELKLAEDVSPLVLARAVKDSVALRKMRRELVAAQQELECTKAWYAAAMHAARCGTWKFHIPSDVVEWSPDLHAIFGMAPGTFRGNQAAFFELVHPDDRELMRDVIDAALAERQEYEVQFRFRHASGEYRWMLGRGRGFFDADGTLIEMAGVGIDITDRKRAEEQLSQQENVLRQIGDNLPDGVLYQVAALPGGQRRFTYLGPGFERLTGVPIEEALRDASRIYQLIHPEDAPHMKAEEERSFRENCAFDVEVRSRHGVTGEWRWVHMRSTPRVMADGTKVWSGIYTDVTDRRRVEEALAGTVERLDLAQRAGRIGVFDWEVQTGRIIWSEEERRLFGVDPADFDGTIATWAARVHPDDLERIQNELQQAMARHQVEMGFAFRIIHGVTGAAKWIEGRGRFSYGSDGQPIRMVGVNYDVTERRESQQQLTAVNRELGRRVAELEAVADVLPVGIAIAHDCECDLVTANPSLQRILRFEAQQPADSSTREAGILGTVFYLNGREIDRSDLPLQRAARTGKAVPAQEFEVRTKDGAVLHLLVNAAPLLNEDGTPRGSVAAAVDISEPKRIQRALQDADSRKNEFLAMLSHELRNPLAAIRNALQVLESAGTDEDDATWARGVIARQSGQLTRLVDDLLDVARVTRGKIELRKSSIDLASALDQAVESVRSLFLERNHDLQQNYPRDGSLRLDADPSRLEQIVVNLLTNAAKYTKPGGVISLEATRQGGEIAISVRDSGIGIPPEKLPEMFELFAQGERPIDRSEGGLGLGLTIVRRLAELHGGRATASSEGVGKGSVFTVTLPVATSKGPVASLPPAGTPSFPPPADRVLVIDDNVDTAHGLARLLARRGYIVQVAYDGFTGVQYAHTFAPEIMLVDLGLPGMTGYEVAEQIRSSQSLKGMFLVAVSGYGQEEDRTRTRQVGFDHHLVKPVPFEVLETLLRERSSRRASASTPVLNQ